ncbi:MAG: enoyl-CoA hydratase/isomerase family protein [Chloroflexi bacterium]|nr:enoyl-CoA hydratase/isomerase family protein [Chloroflexota bacterium]MBT7081375.1 enoyl-CoA hydratase/isomerase family protein [Chloroflexota bacterium]MBT7290683.1 enoyl-CoA hydratase/isomerase family protein [Chloroflexota bacterium]
MAYENIKYEVSAGVAILTFDRPEMKNAISVDLSEEVEQVLDEVAINDDIKVLLITGGKDIFSSGMDLKAGRAKGRRAGSIFSIVDSIAACEKPTIAAIAKYALGGGCEVALSCDIRIASDNTKFGFPEINMGVMPGAGGTLRLPRLIGDARAKEMMFTGERFTADQALAMGLINKVVTVDELLDEATTLAKAIATKDINALKIIKKCINDGLQMDISRSLQYAKSMGTALMGLKKMAAPPAEKK